MELSDLHIFDPVRVIWLDSYTPGENKWATVEYLDTELVDAPTHETIGGWMGIRGDCVVVSQSRGVCPGMNRVDATIAIPLVSMLRVEQLETADVYVP